MKKFKDPELFAQIKKYLTLYLPVIRQKSENTIDAARCGLNLFVDYICEIKGIGMNDIATEDFTAAAIIGFMGWLREKRKNENTSINQRLSQVRSFCRYLYRNNVLQQEELINICDIAMLKDDRKEEFVYLSVPEVKEILETIDRTTKPGFRDRFFIAIMYDSGARDQEMLDLRVGDFVVKNNKTAELHVIGKGTKYRCVPISEELIEMYYSYLLIYHNGGTSCTDDLLFYTIRHGDKTKMSSDNVQRFLRKYEDILRLKKEDYPHLYPHLFRRTRAMHLYIAGVPLPLISEWLGHTHIETTQIYAKATMDMKRQALKKLHEQPNSVLKNDAVFKYANDKEAMKKLCGLSK